jgi:hypothetical protein
LTHADKARTMDETGIQQVQLVGLYVEHGRLTSSHSQPCDLAVSQSSESGEVATANGLGTLTRTTRRSTTDLKNSC